MESTRYHLPAHRMQRLAAPAVVHATSGLVWLTIDRVPEDILLAAGESRHFAQRAEVVAYALGGDADIETSPHSPETTRAARGRTWGERLSAWRRAWSTAPASLGGAR